MQKNAAQFMWLEIVIECLGPQLIGVAEAVKYPLRLQVSMKLSRQ